VLDIGGGASGFGVALAQAGLEVTVVDPDIDGGRPAAYLQRWASSWKVDVSFHGGDLPSLRAPPASYDHAFCLSVIEHIADPSQRAALVAEAHRLLRPGGRLVVTLDLCIGIQPFADPPTWGDLRNVSVAELLHAAPFELVEGVREELLGLPDFRPDLLAKGLREGRFLVSGGHILSQGFALEKRT